MNYKLVFVFTFLAIIYFAVAAKAVIMPGTVPLPKAISSAGVVIVADIVSQTPDASATMEHHFSFGQIAPPALYTFHVLAILKGKCANNLHIHLPEVLSTNYGGGRFNVKTGHHVFLLLNSGTDGVLTPVDNAIPLIRLADIQTIPGYEANVNIQSEVVSTLISSLSDISLRTANISVMKDVIDSSLPMRLFPYLNSSDTDLRATVLFCMATNQQVAAIPRIAELSLAVEKQNPGSGSLMAMCLSKYHSVEAVPYLNPLVVTCSDGLRNEAMMALYKIADKSSIPYLVLVLRDPDPTENIPGAADVALHRLIPALGPVSLKSRDEYVKHRSEEAKLIDDWWADELNGKHVESGGKSAIVTDLPATPAQLCPLLFSPDAPIRRTVVLNLEDHADIDSIPYLVLALQDPDETVNYNAYKILHRLVGDLGPAVGAEQFRSHHAAELQRVYSWWNVYLSPKPFHRPDTTGFIPLPDGK